MPVPAVVKATLFFQQGSFGWTESFFWSVASNDLNAQMASLQIIAQKRAAILGTQAFVKAERVSFETDQDGLPVSGDSFLAYTRYLGQTFNGSDDADAAVLVTMRDVTAHRRRNMYLRGIWDDVNGAGGFYLPGITGWQSGFNNWAAAMLARQVGWMPSTVIARGAVANYTVDPVTGYVTVVCDGDPFAATVGKKQEVRFTGVNVRSPLNGMQLVTPFNATSCNLEKPLALLPYVGGGTVAVYGHSFNVVSTIDAQKIVTRRAGAPLLQSRGRRRPRVRA
jgi:hypothetical protein